MTNYERVAGALLDKARIVRAVVEKNTRPMDEDREKGLVALGFIEGAAMALMMMKPDGAPDAKRAARKRPAAD